MTPDLTSYDVLLVNSSAGKDSLACLDVVTTLATAAGVKDRIIVVHADLGRVEWEGTRELAERQAHGLRFETVRNRSWPDLLARIESRGSWPDLKNRYCTSEFKTGQVYTLLTRLVAERRNTAGWIRNADGGFSKRKLRVLNILGIRAQESPKRAKELPFRYDTLASNKTKRDVDRWYPIHDWSVEQVWEHIRSRELEYHPAYDLGLPRLSCVFCVFASKPALVLAAQHNPELAQDYAAAEARMNHTFRQNLSMAEVVAAAGVETVAGIDDWAA